MKFALNNKLFFYLFQILFLTLFISPSVNCDTLFGRRLKTLTIRVGGHEVTAEIARTQSERNRGLMFRESIGKEEGMLFVFPQERSLSFWMKNTLIPLDVGFFDSQGYFIEYKSMEPDNGSKTYHSSEPALYALEMRKGWFREKNIKKYAKLELPEPITGLH